MSKSTIQTQIQRELLVTHGISTNDRRAALQVARSLQSQLFFYEVEWVDRPLQDGVEDVYMFWDDQEGASDARMEREELPTAVITLLTRCYASSCDEDNPCYSYTCPRRVGRKFLVLLVSADTVALTEEQSPLGHANRERRRGRQGTLNDILLSRLFIKSATTG